jgi:glycosyltransferase involved in cell wall biosynthesis
MSHQGNLKKLAIVSTFNENCGNASYTNALRKEFSRQLFVKVFALDLFLLQSREKRLVKAGDLHIKEMCEKLAEYDYVNIQFEAGLFGSSIRDIKRRITWLIRSASNVTVCMHRVDTDQVSVRQAFVAAFKQRRPSEFFTARARGSFSRLSKFIIDECRRQSRKHNVWIKVHTKRELRAVRDVYGNSRVFDFPLTFLNREERRQVRSAGSEARSSLWEECGFSPGDKVVGLFGYISNYKGFETAISALALLPDQFKLAIFGSQHPQTVRRNEDLNPYVGSLLELMRDLDEARFNEAEKLATIDWVTRYSQTGSACLSADVRKRTSDRVRFIGSLSDDKFLLALRFCDVVVLPYVEVGQSMSGVAILAMEAGAKIICSNNKSFFELKKYHEHSCVGFDVGNYIELSQKIRHATEHPSVYESAEHRDRSYERYNVQESVRTQLSKFNFQTQI